MNFSDHKEKLTGQSSVMIINAGLPSCLLEDADNTEITSAHLIIEKGKITDVIKGTAPDRDLPVIDMDDGMIWPCFTDIHTHLDKGHIWPRRPNPDGTFMGALTNVGEDRAANWTAKDVEARFRFSLKCAYAHGTSAIRTHLDSIGPQIDISWPVFEKLRDEWANRIELQAASLFGIDALEDDIHLPAILRQVTTKNGVLGAVAYPVPKLETYLDQLFCAAKEHGLQLDFHADETRDPTSDCLLKIAEAAKRHAFDNKILVGHCCSLARQSEGKIDRTLDLVAGTNIGIVALPLCNLYLQDRLYKNDNPVTPRWRGVTLLHEMKARDIDVMIASDNTRDPFYAYGDMDALEVYREATRIAHLDHPVGDWPAAITATPSTFSGFRKVAKIAKGAPADFILIPARSWSELLSRPQSNRIVVRNGQAIDTTLPDYRDLDEVVGKPD